VQSAAAGPVTSPEPATPPEPVTPPTPVSSRVDLGFTVKNYSTDVTSYNSIVNNAKSIDQIATANYLTDSYGNITGAAPADQVGYVNNNGIKPLVLISNNFDSTIAQSILESSSKSQTFINNLINVINALSLAKKNKDFWLNCDLNGIPQYLINELGCLKEYKIKSQFTNLLPCNELLQKSKEMKIIIDGMKEEFISNIVHHFSNKYNMTIKKDRMQKNYGYEITYNNIIDDIILQLDGFTFTERAIQELKAKTKTTYNYNDYRKSSNMSIKNNKVIVDGYFSYKDTIWNEYRLNGNFGDIFTALYHFDNGTIPTNGTELHNKYCGYNNERKIDNYEKYEPSTLTKIIAIKFYKNGKLEIEFKNYQYASYFAKEYLGYMEKSA
jgi:hypothetical protein